MENTLEEHDKLTREIIALANEMVARGYDNEIVSAAMMAASAIFATFAAAGNEGYLEESGVDKVADLYKVNLSNVQNIKRKLAEQQAGSN